MKVGVIGATGYAGQQLVGLLHQHPQVEIEFLSSYTYENEYYAEIYGLYRQLVDLKCIGLSEALERAKTLDVLFIALPHGKSMTIVDQLKNVDVKIIDFGADFRLNNPSTIKEWYDLDHKDLQLLNSAVYGLPELNRNKIKDAKVIANPGCYPTASLLGLLPIINEDFVDLESIIIDAKSGVTGAGRKATLALSYSETNENFKAYSVASHRHTPEIEEVLSTASGKNITLNFTPHLVPMQRGILATTYIKLTKSINQESIWSLYKAYYENEYFVRLIDTMPETKKVSRSNFCDISIKLDKRTNRLIIISAIDNLIKGSAGEAIQNMNIMMGYEETTGLKSVSYYL